MHASRMRWCRRKRQHESSANEFALGGITAEICSSSSRHSSSPNRSDIHSRCCCRNGQLPAITVSADGYSDSATGPCQVLVRAVRGGQIAACAGHCGVHCRFELKQLLITQKMLALLQAISGEVHMIQLRWRDGRARFVTRRAERLPHGLALFQGASPFQAPRPPRDWYHCLTVFWRASYRQRACCPCSTRRTAGDDGAMPPPAAVAVELLLPSNGHTTRLGSDSAGSAPLRTRSRFLLVVHEDDHSCILRLSSSSSSSGAMLLSSRYDSMATLQSIIALPNYSSSSSSFPGTMLLSSRYDTKSNGSS